MPDGGTVVFSYDGSWKGMMCTVFDSFSMKTMPAEVYVFGEEEPTLLKVHTVTTDDDHADRVERAISAKLGERAFNIIKRCFLYGEGGKETAIIRYVKRGFDGGPRALSRLADPDVNAVYKMVGAVGNEANMLFGFTRFEDVNGALLAVIHPKHYVLPVMKNYFCKRIRNETFMIYDKTHSCALIHSGSNTAIIPVASLEDPAAGRDSFYSDMWKMYYKHIAIDSRYNPECRRGHMPKRFWEDMPEVRDELESTYRPDLSAGTLDDVKRKIEEDRAGRLPDNKERSLTD